MGEGFRYIDPEMLRGWANSEEYEKLLSFEPEEVEDAYKLPLARYSDIFPFITARVEHPAVMNPYLAIYLWRRYVGDGDVVIDPMAGIGGTPHILGA